MAAVGDMNMGKPVVSQYPPPGTPTYRFRWRTRTQLPERFGEMCRIVSTTRVASINGGSIVVEFADGTKAVTFRGSIRLKAARRWG